MRKFAEPTEQEINEGPQAVSFQIAYGNSPAEQAPNEGTSAKIPYGKLAYHRENMAARLLPKETWKTDRSNS